MDETKFGKDRVFHRFAAKVSGTFSYVKDKAGSANCRILQHWRKLPNWPTNTVDEEFEVLIEELDAITQACYEIIELQRHYALICSELIESSQRIANTVHLLTFLGSDASLLCDQENSTRRYLAVLAELKFLLADCVESIPEALDARFTRLLEYLTNIHERVIVRDKALMSYDKVYDAYDEMTILSTTNGFTEKQNEQYKHLERKLCTLKTNYDNHNLLLKRELPLFFVHVRNFIGPVVKFLYFVQLTLAHQFNSNLMTLRQDFDTSESSGVPVNKVPAKECWESHLSITSPLFAQLDQLLDGNVTSCLEMLQSLLQRAKESSLHEASGLRCTSCRALFNYSSATAGDLAFSKGDIITVLESSGDWWRGRIGENEGYFPALYVEKLA